MAALPLLAVVACSSSSTSIADGSDAATRNPVCPNAAPTPGTLCLLAEGTVCDNYPGQGGGGGCYCCPGGGASFVCVGGKWGEQASAGTGGGPPQGFACPPDVPVQGSPCTPSCGGAQQICSYDCVHGNGANSTANCVAGAWNVQSLSTSCRDADGGRDAADAADAADSGCTSGSFCDGTCADAGVICASGLVCCAGNRPNSYWCTTLQNGQCPAIP